jgi:Flp pilus assembly protein TadD
MIHARNGGAIRHAAGGAILLLAMSAVPSHAQSQRKSPPKPTASSASTEKEDPLAALLQQATQSIDKNDFAAAVEPLQKYLAERPEYAYAHFQLGYAYAGLKRTDDAKTEFSRAIALDPKMDAAYLNLGLVVMDGDPAGAAEAFLHAADLQPTESKPRFLAGFSLEHAGNFPEAIAQYRSALELSPKDYESHFALGRVLLRTNDAPGAETQFREAVTAHGDSATARLGLAHALLVQKKFDAASDALAEYLKLNPGDKSAHFDRASALLELNRYDDALAELDLAEPPGAPALGTSPETHVQILKMRSEIYADQKKWKEAGETLTEAIKASPRDAEIAAALGRVDIELHNYPAAVNILVQVYKQNTQSADALRDLSNALFLNENFPEALDAMDRLAKLEPPKPGSWFVRAICYDKLSHKTEAIDAYQKFLDLDNGQHDTQDFQARRRIYTLQSELGQTPKKKK